MDDHSYVLAEFLNRDTSIELFLERVKEVQIVYLSYSNRWEIKDLRGVCNQHSCF